MNKTQNHSAVAGAQRLRRFTARMVLAARRLRTCWTLKRPQGRAPFASQDLTSQFNDESQRDSGLKPRVARNELPWAIGSLAHNPNGVASRFAHRAATPLGLKSSTTTTQGSSVRAGLANLATLGWGTQSLWDCRSRQVDRAAAQPFIQLAFPNRITANTASEKDAS